MNLKPILYLYHSQHLQSSGHHGWRCNNTFPPLHVFCWSHVISKYHSCPLVDAVFPSLPLSTSPSWSFHCPLQNWKDLEKWAYHLSRLMTKPTKWLCAQPRLRSVWASAQSDQSLRCAFNGYLRTQAFFTRTAKTQIRLGGCPGWSESSLGAHAISLVLSRCGSSDFPLLRHGKEIIMASIMYLYQESRYGNGKTRVMG